MVALAIGHPLCVGLVVAGGIASVQQAELVAQLAFVALPEVVRPLAVQGTPTVCAVLQAELAPQSSAADAAEKVESDLAWHRLQVDGRFVAAHDAQHFCWIVSRFL
jgi:hypothetical protein